MATALVGTFKGLDSSEATAMLNVGLLFENNQRLAPDDARSSAHLAC